MVKPFIYVIVHSSHVDKLTFKFVLQKREQSTWVSGHLRLKPIIYSLVCFWEILYFHTWNQWFPGWDQPLDWPRLSPTWYALVGSSRNWKKAPNVSRVKWPQIPMRFPLFSGGGVVSSLPCLSRPPALTGKEDGGPNATWSGN